MYGSLQVVEIPLARVVLLALTLVEDEASLPHQPYKAQVLNARYQGQQDESSMPYEFLDQVSCHIYLRRSGPHQALDRSPVTLGPFTFTVGDGEVNFADPMGPWFLGGRQVERFGCM